MQTSSPTLTPSSLVADWSALPGAGSFPDPVVELGRLLRGRIVAEKLAAMDVATFLMHVLLGSPKQHTREQLETLAELAIARVSRAGTDAVTMTLTDAGRFGPALVACILDRACATAVQRIEITTANRAAIFFRLPTAQSDVELTFGTEPASPVALVRRLGGDVLRHLHARFRDARNAGRVIIVEAVEEMEMDVAQT